MEATAPSTSDGGQVSDEPLSQRSGSIIEDRPKLQPKRPSTRPFSPIRKQVILLETAQPSVAIRQPQQWVVSGDQVKVLSSVLGKNGLQGVIPSVFKQRLSEVEPATYDEIPAYCFDDTRSESSVAYDNVWKEIMDIYEEAARCQARQKDENAWARVVWKVLELGLREANASRLEVLSVQSQSIDPSMLPQQGGGIPFGKKADLALVFDRNDQATNFLYQKYSKVYPGRAISHLSDAYTSTIWVTCALEIKESGGNQTETSLQLAVFHSALLKKLAGMIKESEVNQLLPAVLCWTVIGHEWKLYISTQSDDGSTTCLGPFDHLVAGTGSLRSLFTLIELIKRASSFLEQTWWPTMKLILDALVAKKTAGGV